jgi:hypothetical protein
MGKIHAGKTIKPGGRYDRVLTFLRARGAQGATTWEIIHAARVGAVSAVISELRSMGHPIPTSLPDGSSQDGAAMWRYWLTDTDAARHAYEEAARTRGRSA